MKSIYFLLVGTILLSTMTGCKKILGKKSNSKVFKADLFKLNLQAQLNGAVGYAIVINQNGSLADSASFGIAQQNASSGTNIPASVYADINIASVTKALTGMAVIKLLEQNSVPLNSSIAPWLPSVWTVSGAVSNITFHELLTHTSGIRQSITSWDSLRSVAARPLAGTKTYSYANANFALFRAIIPKLYKTNLFNNMETVGPGFETWMDNQYITAMQELVFSPAQIANAICNVDPMKTTMMAFNEVGTPLIQRNTGDWTAISGGGGYYLSTFEMAKAMAYLAHTGNILSTAQKKTMDDNLYGWDPEDAFNTDYGRAYGKDGALFWDNNNSGGVDAGDSGLQTWVGKFPGGIELALSVNSLGSSWRNLPFIVRVAYENAWVQP
ncbi:MAG: serine hydrolase [Chitinophagales bacterium]|nr:serine hydrolase [Chitinophagales bacterium]